MSRMIAAATLVMALSVAVPAGAEKPRRDAPEKASDSGDKMVCKKFADTGSLVSTHRVCKTKTEWQRDRDAVRQNATSSGGCNNLGDIRGCG